MKCPNCKTPDLKEVYSDGAWIFEDKDDAPGIEIYLYCEKCDVLFLNKINPSHVI